MFRIAAVVCLFFSCAIVARGALEVKLEKFSHPIRVGSGIRIEIQFDVGIQGDWLPTTFSLCNQSGKIDSQVTSLWKSDNMTYYFWIPTDFYGKNCWINVKIIGRDNVEYSADTSMFDILPPPHITYFYPQVVRPGQDISIIGIGFDNPINFAKLTWQDEITGKYYYSLQVPARLQHDGEVHLTIPESVFFQRNDNGMIEETPLSALMQVDLVILGGFDLYKSNKVNLKIGEPEYPRLDVSLCSNANDNNVFTIGKDALRFVIAGDNIDSLSITLVKIRGTECIIPIGTLFDFETEFNDIKWDIPSDILPGVYYLSFSFGPGNFTETTEYFTIAAPPPVPPTDQDVPTVACLDGLEIKFANEGDGTPDITNVEPKRFFIPYSLKKNRGITTFKIFDINDPKLLPYWKKKLSELK